MPSSLRRRRNRFHPQVGTTTTTTTTTFTKLVLLQGTKKSSNNDDEQEDEEESFPDPHALMEYLDGDGSLNGEDGAFLSFEEYLELQRKRQYLRSCPIFRACSDDDLSRIADAMILQKVAPHEELVVQGESGDAMYFLKSGTFQAIGKVESVSSSSSSNGTSSPTNAQTTTTIYTTYSKEGSYFGELALLFDQTRAASIVSISSEPAHVYRLEKAAFLDSLVDSPVYETARRLVLAKYKSKRLRDVLPKIRFDEIVGLIKARLFTPQNKSISNWLMTLRTFALGACAMLVVTNHIKAVALKPLVLVSMAVLAHLL